MVKWPPKHCVFHSREKKESATKTLHMLYSRKGKCHQDIAHAIQQKRRLSPRHCTCHLQKKEVPPRHCTCYTAEKENATKTLHMLYSRKGKCHQDIAHAIYQKKESATKTLHMLSTKKRKCHQDIAHAIQQEKGKVPSRCNVFYSKKKGKCH